MGSGLRFVRFDHDLNNYKKEELGQSCNAARLTLSFFLVTVPVVFAYKLGMIMRRKSIVLALFVMAAAAVGVLGQDLYMPRSVRQVYSSGVRQMDGRPGARYFQNKSVHTIRLTVEPPGRNIVGSEEIVYTNNGPVPLERLVLRFEMNAHAPEAMREKPVEAGELTDDAVIDEFAENGKVKPWSPLVKGKGRTVNSIQLENPLKPGESVKLSFKWHFELASVSDRDGAIDETTFYLAYFYPRIAVLDQVYGWDADPHMLGGHEFYGEFNDYNVEITVPKNYLVWGTGDLQNYAEVLQPAYAERLRKSFTSDDTINISSVGELKDGKVTAQTPKVTWKWKADKVPDVVFAVSDHYIWDAGSMVVDKSTGRRALTQAAYDEPSKNFRQMVKFIKSSLDFSSNDYPGVPYPYSKMTVVRGFSDMEAPMMANDSSQEDANMQHFIAAHEIFHTYFPFMMGINERRYAFMDEGWATAFEYLFNSKRFGKDMSDRLFKAFRVQGWANSTDPAADLPIMTPENALSGTSSAYGANKYGKAAIGYLALRDLLGDEQFKKSLQTFMRDWEGKHPAPWDFFFSINTSSGKNLNWFWNAWFFGQNYIDQGITDVETAGNSTVISLRNTGGYPAPSDLVITFADGSKQTTHQTPAAWEKNLRETTVTLNSSKPIASIDLDTGIYIDAYPSDNKWTK